MSKTQENAIRLLDQLQEAEGLVQSLSPLRPILEAATKGKPIQLRHFSGWKDGIELSFIDPAHHYRIKPATVKIRRFWWIPGYANAANEPRVLICTEKEYLQEPRESWKGFAGWIDNTWQEHEVPVAQTAKS